MVRSETVKLAFPRKKNSIFIVESKLAEIGEEVYSQNRAVWEKAYLGKVVAIDVESRSLAGVGESLDEAYDEALKKHPGRQSTLERLGRARQQTACSRLIP